MTSPINCSFCFGSVNTYTCGSAHSRVFYIYNFLSKQMYYAPLHGMSIGSIIKTNHSHSKKYQHTLCESPEINRAKQVSKFLICTSVLQRTDLTDHGHLIQFGRKGLDGRALLGQPSKGHPSRTMFRGRSITTWTKILTFFKVHIF